ncbi:GAF domain-containing sensor histidine kinase [Flavobacterium silvaticum]|uniref:histidine kinase n=1 Tax=Flavobacterium silvaticum TaxID=1852020 RepID=A0A972FN42_9FLAO|nr:ATP-binding protein [Flavobacterium silvaticum]NMH28758.1 GHKL domain-containing protein [Flavobacterium silvaticum]
MLKAPIPSNDRERLDALLSYQILDTPPEKEFDDITRLASEICNTPISVITLMDKDRQWFKSIIGLDAKETDRESSFCGHAINTPHENFIIENAHEDVRFFDNPVVTDGLVGSYVGVPLVTPDGFALGALCVIDSKPKKLEEYQIKALEKLAGQVTKLLELHKINLKLVESHNMLADRYRELERFSSVVSHDLKSPLNNIIAISTMFREEYSDRLDENGNQMIGYISVSAEQLKKLIDGILEHYKYDGLDTTKREKIRLVTMGEYLIGLFGKPDGIAFILPQKNYGFRTNSIAFGQVLYNLIANAIKYNDKPEGRVEITYSEDDGHHIISVIDNGRGIKQEHFGQIFELFKTLGQTDRFKSQGTGIGLSSVKKLLDKIGGRIEVESEFGMGSTFRVYLNK